MAAGLVAMAARVSSDPGAIAQAESIRERVAPLAAEDAEAYRDALSAMRAPSGETGEARDEMIRRALVRAAEVPLQIAEAGANVASLAASVAERGSEAVRGDAAAAAILSAGAARGGRQPGRDQPRGRRGRRPGGAGAEGRRGRRRLGPLGSRPLALVALAA